MLKCKYSISFEFDIQAPITERGIVEGSSVKTVVKRALIEAIERNPNTMWASMVIVLERIRD